MTEIGKSMPDIRLSNRSAVLKLLFSFGGISRKDLAARLGLTPAAISNIVGELIRDGVVSETKKVAGNSRMGRREILVEIDLAKYKALCAYIPTREDTRVTCVNFEGKVIYTKDMRFAHDMSGEEILDAICDEMLAYVHAMPIEERAFIVGVGLGIKGIYDDRRGLSVNSFGLWENNVPVRDIVHARLPIQILADNNIRCVAGAEIMWGRGESPHSMLFVKLGPLIGGAFVLEDNFFKGFTYHAMEIGHSIVDPLGSICRCGKRGCLETVMGFDVLTGHISILFSRSRTPILYQITGGDKSKINMETIMQAFDRGEITVCSMMDGAMARFAEVIVNAMSLVNPQRITLYGYPFESVKFMKAIREKIYSASQGEISADIDKSSKNLQLDDLGCASIVIRDFIAHGGLYTPLSV